MTLTEAAHWTKRFGVIFLGAFLLFIFATLLVVALTKENTYNEFLTPDFACTNTKEEFLENKLVIPSLVLADGSENVFELETESGSVDSLPRVANVHKFNISGQSLNAQGEAKIIANKLGFDVDTIQRTGAEYVFNNAKAYQTVIIKAKNLNFQMKTNFAKFGSIDTSANLPSEAESISLATNYLKGKGLLYEDYFETSPEVVNINILPNGTFSQAKSRSEAELIRVDFYREKPLLSVRSDITDSKKIKESLEKKLFPSTTDSIVTDKGRVDIYNFNAIVAYQNPNDPNISVYIGPKNSNITGGDNSNQYVYQVNFNYYPIDSQACGTYSLISPSEALSIVQGGKGSLVYLNEKNGDDVVSYVPKKVLKFTIYTITLGYYEPKDETKYLQPVYIVSGEATLSTGIVGKFHYYVPAVDYDVVTNKVIKETPTTDDSSSLL